MTIDLPVPDPTPDAETQGFWDATARGSLRLPQCVSCGHIIWYPRSVCPMCGSQEIKELTAAGTGTVYSFTIVRKGRGPYADAVPYVVAYVELDEGPHVITNIVGAEVSEVHIGQRVELAFATTANGYGLYRFTPIPA